MIKTTTGVATPDEVRRLLRLVAADPEIRAEVRRAILTEELLELPERVDRLTERVAEIDARLTERMDQLTEVVTQLVQRMDRLSDRMDRFGAQVVELNGRLSMELEAIRASQRRTEGRIDQMWNLVGIAIEVAAEISLTALARDRGFELASKPISIELDGDGELDTVASVTLADGRTATVVVEAKFRLRGGDVRKHRRRVAASTTRERLGERGYHPPYQAFAYGEVIYVDALDEARALGIGLYGPSGDRHDIEVIERP